MLRLNGFKTANLSNLKSIQIQPMLRLNMAQVAQQNGVSLIQIQPMLRLNPDILAITTNYLCKFKYNQC